VDSIFDLEPFILLQNKLILWTKLLILNLPNLLLAAVVITLFFLLASFAKSLMTKMFLRVHWPLSLELLLSQLVRVLIICLGFVIALNILKLDKAVFSVLAGVGVLGLALGFAFRDLASNFISGIFIAANSPFNIGDLIQVKDVTGKVITVRLRDTILENASGQRISVPNQEFMTNKIFNYNQKGHRRLVIEFGTGSGDDLEVIRRELLKIASEHNEVLQNPEPQVHFDTFGDSSIGISFTFWVNYPGTDHLKVRDDIFLKVKALVDTGRFTMPNPIHTLEWTPETWKLLALKMLDGKNTNHSGDEAVSPNLGQFPS
jgi:small conductance mechanosensitive channel